MIDDESWTLAGLRKSFQWADQGFEVVREFTGSREALKYLASEPVDVVFTDIRMPGISGLELLQRLRAEGSRAEVVIISGFSEFEYAKEAMRWSATDYLVKPVSLEEAGLLLRRLKTRLDDKAMLDSNAHRHGKGLPDGNARMREEKTARTGKESFCQSDFRVGNHSFSELLDHMQAHFAEPLQLRDLAVRYHLSISYCCLLFQRHLSKTFSEHLTDLRMKCASSLLRDGELNIAEVHERAGFSDYYYFIRVFRKHFGITPTRYRKGQERADAE